MSQKISEVVARWSWEFTPKEAARQAFEKGYDIYQVAKEMQKQGYLRGSIIAFLGERTYLDLQ